MTNRANANHITFNITTKQATRAAFDISSRERFTLTDPAPAGWRKLAAPRRAGKKPACIAQPIVVPFPRSFRVLAPLHGITRVRPSLPSTRSPAPAPENADLVRAPRVPRTSLHPPQCPQGSVGALLAAFVFDVAFASEPAIVNRSTKRFTPRSGGCRGKGSGAPQRASGCAEWCESRVAAFNCEAARSRATNQPAL